MAQVLSMEDVEKHLENKQVFFKKEITNIDLKRVTAPRTVYKIGDVRVHRIDTARIAFSMVVDDCDMTMYLYKSDIEFFNWVQENFIPVRDMAALYFKTSK